VSGSQGRDWFDLEWYVCRAIPLHLEHVAERARQSGPLAPSASLQRRYAQRPLAERILGLDVARARQDIERFIVDPEPLAICSRSYFQQLAQRIQLV
jgi:hypothetical protein